MTITGTRGCSPGVYDRSGKPSDWWNVGILIIEMLAADNPLRGNNRESGTSRAQGPPAAAHDQGRRPVSPSPSSTATATRLGTPREPGRVVVQGQRRRQGRRRRRRRRLRRAGRRDRSDQGTPLCEDRLGGAARARMKPPFKLDIEGPMTAQRSAARAADARLLLPDGRLPEGVDGDAADVAAQAEDQASFDNFDFVSTQVFEELLDATRSRWSRGARLARPARLAHARAVGDRRGAAPARGCRSGWRTRGRPASNRRRGGELARARYVSLR